MNKQTFIIIVDLLQKQYQIELDCAKFLDNEYLFDNIGRVTDLLISEFYQDEALDKIFYPYIFEWNTKLSWKDAIATIDKIDYKIETVEDLYEIMEKFKK